MSLTAAAVYSSLIRWTLGGKPPTAVLNSADVRLCPLAPRGLLGDTSPLFRRDNVGMRLRGTSTESEALLDGREPGVVGRFASVGVVGLVGTSSSSSSSVLRESFDGARVRVGRSKELSVSKGGSTVLFRGNCQPKRELRREASPGLRRSPFAPGSPSDRSGVPVRTGNVDDRRSDCKGEIDSLLALTGTREGEPAGDVVPTAGLLSACRSGVRLPVDPNLSRVDGPSSIVGLACKLSARDRIPTRECSGDGDPFGLTELRPWGDWCDHFGWGEFQFRSRSCTTGECESDSCMLARELLRELTLAADDVRACRPGRGAHGLPGDPGMSG